jgi:hypothetical protein
MHEYIEKQMGEQQLRALAQELLETEGSVDANADAFFSEAFTKAYTEQSDTLVQAYEGRANTIMEKMNRERVSAAHFNLLPASSIGRSLSCALMFQVTLSVMM